MKKLLAIPIVLILLLVSTLPAIAATTQDVTISATPSYVSISNDEATWPIGIVSANTTYWAGTTPFTDAPADPLEDGNCRFTVTNNGSVTVDISITGNNFTGGVGWTLHADTVGENIVVLSGGISGAVYPGGLVALTNGDAKANFIADLAAAGTKKWGLQLETGTFTDGVAKEGIVRLTAAIDS